MSEREEALIMAMKRARTPSLSIEALNLFAQLPGAEQSLRLDETTASDFGTTVATGLAESFANPQRLHGHWAQDLFRAVLISLDEITLIKDEDAGELYHDESRSLHLPDYRVVTKAGEHLLVEVKNVAPRGMLKPNGTPKTQRIPADVFTAKQEYAQLTGARLVFAHFWSGINWWTIVDAGRFTRNGKNFEITVNDAASANEFGLLGDLMLVTPAVITVIVLAAGIADGPEIDPKLAASLSFLPFVPHTVRFACDGVPVRSRSEYELVKAVALYGGAEIIPYALLRDEAGAPVGMVVNAQSPGRDEDPNPLGSRLSSIYSARYITATKDPVDGSVKQMRYQPDPTLTRLAAIAHAEGPKRVMPVEVFRQFPAPPTAD